MLARARDHDQDFVYSKFLFELKTKLALKASNKNIIHRTIKQKEI